MSPDITRLLIGADPEASLAECENAARVRATTSAVTAPSTANDPAPSAPQVPPKNLTSRLAPRAPLHAVRGGEEVRKGITAIIPRLAGPFDPMNGRYNREESVIGHSFVMVLRMRVAGPARRTVGRAWPRTRFFTLRADFFTLYRLESKLRRSRGTIGRGQAIPPAPSTPGGRLRRARGRPVKSPWAGRG